jgi:tetratricopeptide (TPR) repeat protein
LTQSISDTATGLNNLGLVLQFDKNRDKDISEALPIFERALSIREKVLGPSHSKTATSLDNLASQLREQGALARARPFAERALAIREASDPEHPNTTWSLNNYALLLRDLSEA